MATGNLRKEQFFVTPEDEEKYKLSIKERIQGTVVEIHFDDKTGILDVYHVLNIQGYEKRIPVRKINTRMR